MENVLSPFSLLALGMGCFLLIPIWIRLAVFRQDNNKIEFNGDILFVGGVFGLRVQWETGKKRLAALVFGHPFVSTSISKRETLPKPAKKEKAKPSKPGKRNWKLAWSLKRKVASWTARIFRCFHFSRIRGRFRFGFEDPATTGQVFGYLCCLLALNRRRFQFEPQAVFDGSNFSGQLSLRLFFFPLVLGWQGFRIAIDLGWQFCNHYFLRRSSS